MVVKYVLDTNAVLYFLAGRLAQPLPQAEFYVSVISEIELLSYPLIEPGDESKIKAFLADVKLVDLNEAIKIQAIQTRRLQRLKLPDALIAATAMILNATLLTNDVQLLKIPNLSAQSLALQTL